MMSIVFMILFVFSWFLFVGAYLRSLRGHFSFLQLWGLMGMKNAEYEPG